MAIFLSSENCVLDAEYLYDLNAPPNHSSVPPVISYEDFIRLKVGVIGSAQGNLSPKLLLSSDRNDFYNLVLVDNGQIVGSYNLRGTFKDERYNVPLKGFLRISKEPFYIPQITQIICPINTKVIISVSDYYSSGISGIVVLARRNSLLASPFQNPRLLQPISSVIKLNTNQVELNLPEGMTAIHKYQFSIMALETDGTKYYSNNYTELFPGGKVKHSISKEGL